MKFYTFHSGMKLKYKQKFFQPATTSSPLHVNALRLKKSEVILEAVGQTCFVKKVFLEISQISQENTSARVSFW